MSLWINPDKVTDVLLGNDWYPVQVATFSLDAYEYVYDVEDAHSDPEIAHGGGQSGICAAGFSFTQQGWSAVRVSGPLTSIVAVRHRP